MSSCPPFDVASFARRHIGLSENDIKDMLAIVGTDSLDELLAQTLPADIRQQVEFNLPPALSELQALARARELAVRNVSGISVIGQGYYGTVLPSVIQRNILENPA
jgi:glycine cleavage system P protein (glycine dehydrogenase)